MRPREIHVKPQIHDLFLFFFCFPLFSNDLFEIPNMPLYSITTFSSFKSLNVDLSKGLLQYYYFISNLFFFFFWLKDASILLQNILLNMQVSRDKVFLAPIIFSCYRSSYIDKTKYYSITIHLNKN